MLALVEFCTLFCILTSVLICYCHAVCVLKRCNGDALALAVWMANSSEMLHFLSCDVDIAGLSAEAQNILAECVQHAFLLLVDTLQNSLHQTMPAFISTNPDVDIAPGKHHLFSSVKSSVEFCTVLLEFTPARFGEGIFCLMTVITCGLRLN